MAPALALFLQLNLEKGWVGGGILFLAGPRQHSSLDVFKPKAFVFKMSMLAEPYHPT